MAAERKRRAKRKGPNVSVQPLGERQNVWELGLQRGSRWGNRSCSLRAEPGCLWGHGVEGRRGAAPGLGGLQEQEAAIPTQPACADLELISPETGCVRVCWGRAMKAIALNKTMLPSSVSFGSEAVSPNVLS